MTATSASRTRAHSLLDLNEDWLLADDARRLYLVADGAGRHRGAALASHMVVETFAGAFSGEPTPDAAKWLRQAAQAAAAKLHREGHERPGFGDMCTTLTALHLVERGYHVLHVGDSRAYLFREGVLLPLTRDHTVAYEQYEAGALTRDEVRHHPNQRHLTRTFAASREFVITEVQEGAAKPGDRFLLCTDGMVKGLSDGEIARVLGAEGDLGAACTRLVEAAFSAGVSDDITALAVRME